MDYREVEQQAIKEIIQGTVVPVVSGLAFFVWAYALVRSAEPAVMVFPLSGFILLALYFFAGPLYSALLLILLTVVGFLCMVVVHEPWAPLVFLLETVWLWGMFLIIKKYLQSYVGEQNRVREEEEVLDTRIASLELEIKDIQERRSSLSRQISDYLSLGQIVQILGSALQEEKLIPLIAETSAKFIGRGTWTVKKDSVDSFFQHVKNRRLPLIISDLAGDNRFSARHPSFFSLIAVPLEINGEFLGCLEGTSTRPGAFDESDLRLLSILGGIASIAVNNARLYRTTQELAITDTLTGLYIQSYFLERLDQEIIRSRRHALPLSIALLDVDHFKKFNDTYGHIAGDSILRQLVDILRHRLRETDFLSRYGGEEFAIIMPQTDGREAHKVCEEIRRSISNARLYLPVESFKPVQVKVTACVGLSSLDPEGSTAEGMLRPADEALYRAKRKGRNRVEVGHKDRHVSQD